jgi:uncharacterized protein (DUF302 family)
MLKSRLSVFAAVLPLLALLLAGPAQAQNRIVVPSSRSFSSTVGAIRSGVARGGMMVMATVNQGRMLSMTGLQVHATLLLVGNPTVGKMLFAQNPGVGLYVPLRVYVYQAKNGRVYISYDQPSSLLGRFHNGVINHVAHKLDGKLKMLVHMAAQ